uniref:PRELI domain-containing protein 2 isoform X3 n=1 Tax=Petromyzon marinus TaxID=7757 RepID=A0AAJ7T5E4_PETMA|nr:PRELI domain-containing protein 2 isoform X3 [Petromyzon marinus]
MFISTRWLDRGHLPAQDRHLCQRAAPVSAAAGCAASGQRASGGGVMAGRAEESAGRAKPLPHLDTPGHHARASDAAPEPTQPHLDGVCTARHGGGDRPGLTGATCGDVRSHIPEPGRQAECTHHGRLAGGALRLPCTLTPLCGARGATWYQVEPGGAAWCQVEPGGARWSHVV